MLVERLTLALVAASMTLGLLSNSSGSDDDPRLVLQDTVLKTSDIRGRHTLNGSLTVEEKQTFADV